jgi:hypothetical protein
MASLDLQKPAVLFKMYVKTKEKSENWDKHCELIISRHREPNWEQREKEEDLTINTPKNT